MILFRVLKSKFISLYGQYYTRKLYIVIGIELLYIVVGIESVYGRPM